MNEFRATFRQVVSIFTDSRTQPVEVSFGHDRDTVVIPKQSDAGFEIALECTDSGLVPEAEGWHGSFWDVTVFEAEELRENLREFLSSVTSDAVLEVHSSNGKPYRWRLHYQSEGERVFEETGLIFFNWFGRRSVRNLSNAKNAT